MCISRKPPGISGVGEAAAHMKFGELVWTLLLAGKRI